MRTIGIAAVIGVQHTPIGLRKWLELLERVLIGQEQVFMMLLLRATKNEQVQVTS
jgi:hypothetical protein